jgi:hypothetical protein
LQMEHLLDIHVDAQLAELSDGAPQIGIHLKREREKEGLLGKMER